LASALRLFNLLLRNLQAAVIRREEKLKQTLRLTTQLDRAWRLDFPLAHPSISYRCR
jgi:hypothetical protein